MYAQKRRHKRKWRYAYRNKYHEKRRDCKNNKSQNCKTYFYRRQENQAVQIQRENNAGRTDNRTAARRAFADNTAPYVLRAE